MIDTPPALTQARIAPHEAVLRCVRDPGSPRHHGDWLARWRHVLTNTGVRTSDDQRHALARLVPTLLCGEQSAVAIFHAEAARLQRGPRETSVLLFRSIEADEATHDAALQSLSRALPHPTGLHQIKRRAQRFFMSLGKTRNVAEHFNQIASLDSAVCLIMRSIELSSTGQTTPVGAMACRIKRDEARHVAISRRHASDLGMPRAQCESIGASIRERLVELLGYYAADFDVLGIDPDQLFGRLRREQPS